MLGYRSTEPVSMEREKSVLWRMACYQLWKDGVTKQTIASELHIPLDEIESLIGQLVTQTGRSRR